MKIIILSSCIGFALGLCWGYLLWWGYFEPWHQLTPPPTQISELVASYENSIYVRDAEGAIYVCASKRATECWLRTSVPETITTSSVAQTQACTKSNPAFTQTTGIPSAIRACRQGYAQYTDGSGQFAFVLTDNNRVWAWSQFHSPYEGSPINLAWIMAGFGAIIGSGTVFGRLFCRRLRR